MTHQPINLQEIDFSQPDGEFIYKGQTYQLKEYSNYYFFRNKKHTNHEFIYTFDSSSLYNAYNGSYGIETVFRKKSSQWRNNIPDFIRMYNHKIQRCVQYKEALFSFGHEAGGQYYSPKDNQWILIDWLKSKSLRYLSLDQVLRIPYAFFVQQAVSVYEQELPLIEDKKKFSYFKKKTTKPINFLCGSSSELERLTKIAAFTLPQISSLFKHYSGLIVEYDSEEAEINSHYKIFDMRNEIAVISRDHNQLICCKKNSSKYEDLKDEEIFSEQAEQLFNLIYDYNCFSGAYWAKNYYKLEDGYGGYVFVPATISVHVESPSQHERLEAALELQSWLEGKLPEHEIRAYFE